MAALGLNPVLMIIALPFALVVSVIASTTIFRNVFITYDDFGANSANSQGTFTDTSRNGHGPGVFRFFPGSLLTTVLSQRITSAPTNDYKSQDIGVVTAASCHRGDITDNTGMSILPPTPVVC